MDTQLLNDKYMEVKSLTSSTDFVKVIYAGMHQCYSHLPVYNDKLLDKPDYKLEEIIINKLLKSGRGHYSPLEHASFVLNCCYIPHSVMQQFRTHRIGIGFSVQSFRYTSESLLKAVYGSQEDLEKAIYIKPAGIYSDRNGDKYNYTEEWRNQDIRHIKYIITKYKEDKYRGKSEEHARGILPFDYRQHMVVSFNLRSFFHVLDLRSKKDTQLEFQYLSNLMFNEVKHLAPKLFQWYLDNRYSKARLSP